MAFGLQTAHLAGRARETAGGKEGGERSGIGKKTSSGGRTASKNGLASRKTPADRGAHSSRASRKREGTTGIGSRKAERPRGTPLRPSGGVPSSQDAAAAKNPAEAGGVGEAARGKYGADSPESSRAIHFALLVGQQRRRCPEARPVRHDAHLQSVQRANQFRSNSHEPFARTETHGSVEKSSRWQRAISRTIRELQLEIHH